MPGSKHALRHQRLMPVHAHLGGLRFGGAMGRYVRSPVEAGSLNLVARNELGQFVGAV